MRGQIAVLPSFAGFGLSRQLIPILGLSMNERAAGIVLPGRVTPEGSIGFVGGMSLKGAAA